MKCPACGREVERLYDGLCLDCYIKKNFKIEIKDVNLKFCKICNSFFLFNKKIEPERILDEIIKKYLVLSDNFEVESYKLIDLNISENNIFIIFLASIKIFDKRFEKIFKLSIPFEKIVCDNCRKVIEKYYEAKIQIRGDLHKCRKLLEDFVRRTRKYNVFVSKVEELKEGIDIYVSDSKISKRILEKMKREYGFEIKYSRKLHSFDRQKGKRIYKLSILVRF